MNNPKTRQQWILDLLKSEPTLQYVEGYPKYNLKWRKSESTFKKDWKITKERHKAYQKKVNKAKEVVSIKEEVKAVVKGVRTKIDRLLILQDQVDSCLSDLAEGKTDDYINDTQAGKQIENRRKMTIQEYNQTRKTLKDLQAEISKIEGDYAPKEVDVDLKTNEIDYSKLSEEDLETMLKIASKQK